jgi:hypothetical protein
MPHKRNAFIARHLGPRIVEALADTPVVLLHGPRRAGKSTLAQQIAAGPHPADYITLDDAAVLGAVRRDPQGFVRGLKGPVVIDEVQRAPGLFVAIKLSVDQNRRPGRFLLTGSANVLLVPKISESLAGRIEILTLAPLSQGEIDGIREDFIDRLFGAEPLHVRKTRVDPDNVIRRVLTGGYPEVLTRSAPRRRAWFRSYVTTIIERDIRDLQQIEGLTEMPRLFTLLAARTATLLNVADLSRTMGITQRTLGRYLTLLHTVFLIHRLPAWVANIRRRLLKTPKVLVPDTGLAAHLLNLETRRLADEPELFGHLLETFVIGEVLKQLGWSETHPTLYHFRTAEGAEVDLVMEQPSGHLVGIEVKAATTVGAADFKGLKILSDVAGRRFHRGVVLYMGETAVPFGDKMHALPITSLWRAD